MTKYSSSELDAVYQALANSTRRKILTRLCAGSFTVGELAQPFPDMTLANVSKHISLLEKAGLVRKRNRGSAHVCEISFEPVRSAAALIHYFEQFLDDENHASKSREEEEQEDYTLTHKPAAAVKKELEPA